MHEDTSKNIRVRIFIRYSGVYARSSRRSTAVAARFGSIEREKKNKKHVYVH